MEIKKFIKFLVENTEPVDVNADENDDIVTPDERKIPLLPLVKHGGNHPELPSAFSFNGKNMFYSFDLTNICNRGCPGCYVDRAKETGCNVVRADSLKEYKGDLRKWEHEAKTPEEQIKLQKTKDLVNANGGIRMFSAADYPIIKDISNENDFYGKILKDNGITNVNYFKEEVKSFLDDCAEFGWNAKAITKEPTFIKDHIDHPALKGVNVSMNSHGYGIPHTTVKNMKKGVAVSGSNIDDESARKIAKYSNKIIGRTVTFTPLDIKTVLDHIKVKDDVHIGVITSGHDIPSNGVRYIPSEPQNPKSPKRIIIQTNFPESTLHLLNGDTGAKLTVGQEKSLEIANRKASKKLNVESMPYLMALKETQESENPEDYRIITTLVKDNGVWKEAYGIFHKDTKMGNADLSNHLKDAEPANLMPNFEEQFEKDNPIFDYKFTAEDAKLLIAKMSGKMCCGGDDGKSPISGKCSLCKVKCGVDGCQINGKPTVNPDTLAHLLNEYANRYNVVRNKALVAIRNGRIEVTNTTMPKQKPEPKPSKIPETFDNYKKYHGHELDYIKKIDREIKRIMNNKNPDNAKIEQLKADKARISGENVPTSEMKINHYKFIDMLIEKKNTISGSYEIEELEVKDGDFKGFWNVKVEVEIEYDDGNVGDFNTPMFHPNMGGHYIDDVEIKSLEKYDEHLQDYHKVVLNPHIKSFFTDIVKNSKHTEDIVHKIVGEADDEGDDYSTASGKSN